MKVENPYQAAGTFIGSSYVERDADQLLLTAIKQNKRYPYVVAPRQSGKSSLLIRTQKILDPVCYFSAYVDLSPLNITEYGDFWRNFLEEIAARAELDRTAINIRRPQDTIHTWLQKSPLRFVIFIDEIDTLIGATFCDQFFSKLRSFFNRRAEDPVFKQLIIVLAGAAHPTKLIKDHMRSPFNVGIEIKLDDLTLARTQMLTSHLSGISAIVESGIAERIHEITGGSIYLSQLVLEHLWRMGDTKGELHLTDVETALCAIIETANRDIHFTNIYQLLFDNPRLLDAFKQLQYGRKGIDMQTAQDLRLTGISDGFKPFRNQLYRKVFGEGGPLDLISIPQPGSAPDLNHARKFPESTSTNAQQSLSVDEPPSIEVRLISNVDIETVTPSINPDSSPTPLTHTNEMIVATVKKDEVVGHLKVIRNKGEQELHNAKPSTETTSLRKTSATRFTSRNWLRGRNRVYVIWVFLCGGLLIANFFVITLIQLFSDHSIGFRRPSEITIPDPPLIVWPTPDAAPYLSPSPVPKASEDSSDGHPPITSTPRSITVMTCSDETREVSRVCIDLTEVTVAAYEKCVKEKRCTAPEHRFTPFCNWNRESRKMHPINCVNFTQASTYCKYIGGRLPTESEWESAAQGSSPGDRFPWGDTLGSHPETLLNACDLECKKLFENGSSATVSTMFEASDGWATTAPVGQYFDGRSAIGILDLAGNVAEWTIGGRGPVIRGGSWTSDDPESVTIKSRLVIRDSLHSAYIGFRCVRPRVLRSMLDEIESTGGNPVGLPDPWDITMPPTMLPRLPVGSRP